MGSLSCHPLPGYVAGPSTSQMHIGAVRERCQRMMVLLPIRKVDDPFTAVTVPILEFSESGFSSSSILIRPHRTNLPQLKC